MWNKGKISNSGSRFKKERMSRKMWKNQSVAQDVEQPQFVKQPQTVQQPKDVEQAQRCGTKE